MNKEAKAIYEDLFKKEAGVFNPEQVPLIKDKLLKYIGSAYEAKKAYKDLEKRPGTVQKILGSVGKPPEVNVENLVGKHLGRETRNLMRKVDSLGTKNIKTRLKDLEAEMLSGETPLPHMLASGIGGGLLGAGAGHLVTRSAYEKKLEKAEMDKMRAAAEALGIGMALPNVLAHEQNPYETLDMIAYPRG